LLSKREREVLALLRAGMRNVDVARTLRLSTTNASNVKRRLERKGVDVRPSWPEDHHEW
jgi:DNA-binding CsgD family transcriptional regulator